MKKSIIFFAIFCVLGLALKAQQVPVRNQYVLFPEMYNPAAKGTYGLNRLFFVHQGRASKLGAPFHTEHLSFSSRPLGPKNKFGWGFDVINDREFTLSRVELKAGLGTHVIYKSQYNEDTLISRLRVSIGAQAGVILWGDDFSSIRYWDRADNLLLSNSVSHLEVSPGIDAYYRNRRWEARAGGSLLQLNQLLVPPENDTMIAYPHIVANASWLYELRDSFWIGPMALYRENLSSYGSIGGGQLDIMAKAELRQWGMWAATGVRVGIMPDVDVSYVHGNVGVLLTARDSTRKHRYLPREWSVMGSYEVPVNGSALGARYEVGLNLNFGSLKKVVYDTVDAYLGPFWLNGGMTERFFMENSGHDPVKPPRLDIDVEYSQNYVTIFYSFDDNNFEHSPHHTPGLEKLMTHIAHDVLPQALHSEDERDWYYPQHLTELIYIRFHAYLKEDPFASEMLVDSAYFSAQPLEETVLLDERDQLVRVDPGIPSSLQLAYLKLHYMREDFKKLAHDWFGSPERKEELIEELKITTNNPNQKPMQRNVIELRFRKVSRPYKRKRR